MLQVNYASYGISILQHFNDMYPVLCVYKVSVACGALQFLYYIQCSVYSKDLCLLNSNRFPLKERLTAGTQQSGQHCAPATMVKPVIARRTLQRLVGHLHERVMAADAYMVDLQTGCAQACLHSHGIGMTQQPH